MDRWRSAQLYTGDGAPILGAAWSINRDERWDGIVYRNDALLREVALQFSDLLYHYLTGKTPSQRALRPRNHEVEQRRKAATDALA